MNFAQEMTTIRRLFAEKEREVRGLEYEIESIRRTISRYQSTIEELNAEGIVHDKVVLLFKEISDERGRHGQELIENVLNWALENIPLEQRYSASLLETARGTKKELTIVVQDLDTGELRNLRTQSGTALAQIVSFLLNVIVIILSNSRRIMVLDECFSGLQDQDTIQMFGEILVALAQNEQFLFLMVEHASELNTVSGINRIQVTLPQYEEGTQLNMI